MSLYIYTPARTHNNDIKKPIACAILGAMLNRKLCKTQKFTHARTRPQSCAYMNLHIKCCAYTVNASGVWSRSGRVWGNYAAPCEMHPHSHAHAHAHDANPIVRCIMLAHLTMRRICNTARARANTTERSRTLAHIYGKIRFSHFPTFELIRTGTRRPHK